MAEPPYLHGKDIPWGLWRNAAWRLDWMESVGEYLLQTGRGNLLTVRPRNTAAERLAEMGMVMG